MERVARKNGLVTRDRRLQEMVQNMDRSGALRQLAAQASQGELMFPTAATVILRVRQEIDDPDCQLANAVRMIQAEPLLSARVVAVANSAAYNRSGRAITDVRAAVNLLGFQTVRTLATAMVARQMAGVPDSPADRRLATQLWEHSAYVAAAAQLIARRVTRQDPEAAMFAGMVHEIGGFYLLSRIKDFPGLLDGELTDWMGEDEEVDGTSPEMRIGHAVLKALSAPDSVVAAIEVLWRGYLAFPPATLGDTLLLADQLAPVKSPLFQQPVKNQAELAATIDLIVGKDTLSHILAESAAEVKSLTDALRF
jgi:HD-like signal output (HDOD) protein